MSTTRSQELPLRVLLLSRLPALSAERGMGPLSVVVSDAYAERVGHFLEPIGRQKS